MSTPITEAPEKKEHLKLKSLSSCDLNCNNEKISSQILDEQPEEVLPRIEKKIPFINTHSKEMRKILVPKKILKDTLRGHNKSCEEVKNIIENIDNENNKRNDCYKPMGFSYIDYIIKHPLLVHKEKIFSKNNNKPPIMIKLNESNNNKMKILNKVKSVPDINSSNSTDFNFNDTNSKIMDGGIKNTNITNNNYYIKKNNNNLLYERHNYLRSDIFNLKDDDYFKKKCFDKFYVFPPKVNNSSFLLSSGENNKSNITTNNIINNSNNRNKKMCHLCCTSVPFNILCPENKSFAAYRKEVEKERKGKYYRKSPLSFADHAVKLGSKNISKDYLKLIHENKNVFHKKSYCASFADLHREYKELINKMY